MNLGCGKSSKVGFINVDMEKHGDHVDQVVDLNVTPWPWADNSVDQIFASNCFEHLSPLGRVNGQANIIAVMGEVWRVLRPGGVAELIVPSTDGPGAWQDPTHVTYWNRNTFLYFIDGSVIRKFERSGFPEFSIEGKELGIADTVSDEYGIIWTVARLRKPEVKEVAGSTD